MDAGLATLLEERVDLSIQISLLADSDGPDPMLLFHMKRDLDLLDRRIEKHKTAPNA
jgi:hypothetical protein